MTIFNKTKKSDRGFSIIEMLVVMFLFALLAFVVTQSTLQSFRGARKADASSKVRDNLNFAASIVERNIRNAKDITSACDGLNSTSISFVTQSGVTGGYACTGSSPTYVSDVAANSRITGLDVNITSCSFRCSTNGAYNPPIIDFVFAGVAFGNVSGTDTSFATISRRVVLRVY